MLGPLPDDFDPAADVPAGPWCFVDREDLYPQWETLPFIDPFADPEARSVAGERTARLADHIAGRVGEELDRLHARDYGPAFWRVLLIPWMVCLTQATWKRFVLLREIARTRGEEPLEVALLPPDLEWGFADTIGFQVEGLLEPGFDWWMSSVLLRAVAPGNWTLIEGSLPRVGRSGAGPPSPRHPPLKSRLRRWLATLPFGAGGMFTGPLFSVLLTISSRRRDGRAPSPRVDYDPACEFPAEYLDALDGIRRATVPAAFLGRFADLDASANRRRFRGGRLRVVGGSLNSDEFQKCVAAHALRAGEKLVPVQHGGHYGHSRSLPDASVIEYPHHAFVTWGWTEHGDYTGRFVPLPSPFLSSFRDRHRRGGSRLILVGTSHRVRAFRFDASPTPAQVIASRLAKVRFLGAIPAEIREHAVYRPYWNDAGVLQDAEYFRRRFPDLALLEGDLWPGALSCNLLVLDHPGTSLNIALTANVPVILFWEDDWWPICRQARPLFDRLRTLGVLFRRPDEAAGQVVGVWGRVEDWWLDPAVQAARRAWCERFASTGRFWWLDWIRALARV